MKKSFAGRGLGDWLRAWARKVSMAHPEDEPRFLPPRGNYQALLAYRKAEIVYAGTRVFCRRFIKRGDRTNDQMVQEARYVRRLGGNPELKFEEVREWFETRDAAVYI